MCHNKYTSTMKIKSFFFTFMGLFMTGLLYTGCNSPGNSNGTLKTKDDFANSMKQCSQFAHDHHMNPDSAVKACFILGNECNLGNPPPVVTLNDTFYIYIGKTDSIITTTHDTVPVPLTTTGGTQLTQVQIKWSTGPQTNLTYHETFVGISSAQSLSGGYDYRIAIPINTYNNPRGNSSINIVGPSLPQNSGGGSGN